MRTVLTTVILALIFCPLSKPVLHADTSIYHNTNYTGYAYTPDTQIFDYGTTTGGLVKKIRIGYANDYFSVNWIRIYFVRYFNTSTYETGGTWKVIQMNNLPYTFGYYDVYEYLLPEQDRFELPAGPLGFAVEVSGGLDLALASGGAGNENELWEYDLDEYKWIPFWFGGSPWAGLYMEIIEGPPIDEITCDIKGFKFDDQNANGVWDTGEPAMPGWEMYIDENDDGVYQPAEPNVVTDPNGMYFFENLDSPAIYIVREIMKSGWTQTLPGGPDFEYVIDSEPNYVYDGYHFGNTTQAVMKYGGGDGTPEEPYQIHTADHMNQIGLHPEDWGSHFILMENINMSSIPGNQYNIIGYHNADTDFAYFTGTFDGNYKTIQNFSCTTDPAAQNIGLFGFTENAQISNLTIENAVLTGGNRMGALVGYQKAGMVTNCHCQVTINGQILLGGLAGFSTGQVIQCSTSGTVTGQNQSQFLGGLAGMLRDASVSDCSSSAAVTGYDECENAGGFCGFQYHGTLTDCSSTGPVTAGDNALAVGGLLGQNFSGTCTRCYSTGNVDVGSGFEAIGGFSGGTSMGTEMTQCYSTGQVSGSSGIYIGGLIGFNSGILSHCYSRSGVTGTSECDYLGGLAGFSSNAVSFCYSAGSITGTPGDYWGGMTGYGSICINAFWDTQTSGLTSSAGSKGRTTAQMKQASNYINWNQSGAVLWEIQEGADYPHLIFENTAGADLPIGLITDYLDGLGTEQEPFQIQSPADLNLVGLFPQHFDKYFELTVDLDLSVYPGTEFSIIGTYGLPFSGFFEGNDHRISHFHYLSQAAVCGVGLFGEVAGTIQNLHFAEAEISSVEGLSIGGLAGNLDEGTISNCSVSGSITAGNNSEDIGLLTGSLSGESSADGCSGRGQVTAGTNSDGVGGLIGNVYGSAILTNSSFVGSVEVGNESTHAGGLAGALWGIADSCFSLGSLTAGDMCQYLGGLAGYSGSSNETMYCFSRTSVTAGDSCQYIGGLIGRAADYVRYCYSAGAVAAGQYPSGIGGLIGTATYTSRIQYSYWDTQASGQTQSSGGYPRNTEQMTQQANYSLWNFNTTWQICEGMNYPRLQVHPLPPADFLCPDGVDLGDLSMLVDEWLAEKQSADMAPDGGDGFVDLLDWQHLAAAWMTTSSFESWDEGCDLAPPGGDGSVNLLDAAALADAWLTPSLQLGDIAPAPDGDGRVNLLDFAAFAEFWLEDAGL